MIIDENFIIKALKSCLSFILQVQMQLIKKLNVTYSLNSLSLQTCVVIYFWVPAQKKKKIKKYIVRRNPKSNNNSSENRMSECPKIDRGGSKIQKIKFDSIYWTDDALLKKKIQFKEKSPKSYVYGFHWILLKV